MRLVRRGVSFRRGAYLPPARNFPTGASFSMHTRLYILLRYERAPVRSDYRSIPFLAFHGVMALMLSQEWAVVEN